MSDQRDHDRYLSPREAAVYTKMSLSWLRKQTASKAIPHIKLGRRDLQERLQRFMQAYTQSLQHMDQRLQLVDLRYPNGFALQWNKIQTGGTASAG